jgi:hypothetical protein
MKKKIFLAIAFATAIFCSDLYGQATTVFRREVEIGGEVRFGTPYFQLFGSRFGNKDFSVWTQLDVIDKKSGLGLSVYHLGDFNFSTPTNFWGVDILYSKDLGRNYSMTAFFEYAYFDNFPDMQGIVPAIIFTRKGWVDATCSVVYVYYPRQQEDKHQFTTKGELSKEIFSGVSVRVDAWYDNLYQDHFFGAVGTTIDLTRGFSFKYDVLWKNQKFESMFRIVKNF